MDRLAYHPSDRSYDIYSGRADEGRYNGDEYRVNNASFSIDYNNPDYTNYVEPVYQTRSSYNLRPPSRNASEVSGSYPGHSQMQTLGINQGFQGHPADVVSNLSEDANPLDERFSEHSSALGGRSQMNNAMPIIQERSISRASQRQPYLEQDLQVDSWMTQNSYPSKESSSGLLSNSYKPRSVHTLNKSHSSNNFEFDPKFRKPELTEVIDFLSHQNDAVRANAAAYLQHLSYMDDNIKVQTRALRGIPPLLELVNHPLPEVHRAACGALRNLSYGRANDDNKREIKNQGGITTLVRLIRRTTDQDVLELVTGIIWNLSSCAELKKSIIDEGLKTLLDQVIVPLSGANKSQGVEQQNNFPNYRSTVFRNASGVLRNVSSDGDHARKKMRECDGLIGSLIDVVRWSLNNRDCDGKSVENCVCVFRNLSYACQEVSDPDYLRNRVLGLNEKDPKTGCFGNKSKSTNKQKNDAKNQPPISDQSKQHATKEMAMLWSPSILNVYLPLLRECNNPDTLEATAGAIQNLAACDWQPAKDLREAIRMQKGIQIIVDLFRCSSDKVVCAAATSLRNLALNDKNRELIGKCAMVSLVDNLPSSPQPTEFPLSNDTLAAIESTLYEVIKSNAAFARSFVDLKGVNKLMNISNSAPGIFDEKVVRYSRQLLQKIWKYGELHEDLKKEGWKPNDFASGTGRSSAENTINRPIMSQGRSQQENNSLRRPAPRNDKEYLNQNTFDGGMAYSVPRKNDELPLDALHGMQLSDGYRRDAHNYSNNNNSFAPGNAGIWPIKPEFQEEVRVDDPYRAGSRQGGHSYRQQQNFDGSREFGNYWMPEDRSTGTARSSNNVASQDQLYSKSRPVVTNVNDSWV